jgi:hypothetical protein
MGYLRASKYFSVPRGTLERYVKDTPLSPEELVDVHLGRRTVLPSELKNELVEYCITCSAVLHNHGPEILWTEMSGYKTHDFSVGNKKWLESSI